MTKCLVYGAFCAVLAGANARGEPYWIAYEDDAMPEEVGWSRVWGDDVGPFHGGAQRSIQDGALVLDSLASDQICDFYDIDRSINLGPGETLIAE